MSSEQTGCGRESDVWALGCLFYELLTGEFLFQDSDWVRFFIRVTYEGQELFPPERRQKIDNNPILLTFFHWIVVPIGQLFKIWSLSLLRF
ncbi:Dual specificity phosphatase, catalytic domain containing protein [Balamuthia mandrillaris]